MEEIIVTVPPAKLPVTVAEMRAYLNEPSIEDPNTNAVIEESIETATAMFQKETGLYLITQTLRQYHYKWGRPFFILGYPLQQLPDPESEEEELLPMFTVHYADTADEWQAVAQNDLYADQIGCPATVWSKAFLLSSKVLPPIYLEYAVGFGDDPKDVPAQYRTGIRKMAAFLFENRTDPSADKMTPSPLGGWEHLVNGAKLGLNWKEWNE